MKTTGVLLLAFLLCSCTTSTSRQPNLNSTQELSDVSWVAVAGPVKLPGLYRHDDGLTVRQAIDQAGGCEWWAVSVKVVRNGEEIYSRRPGLRKCQEYSYADAPELQSGDVIEFTGHGY